MPKLVTWIRECDEAPFARFFAPHPKIEVVNARTHANDGDEFDGLLLSGGPDISVDFLNQSVSDPSVIVEPDPVRDAWEFEALRKALAAGKPVLAICKGHQVLNVGLGGTLHLDIRGHDAPEQKLQNLQELRFSAQAAQRFERVNSSHHQAVDRLGEGLEVEAWCAKDDVIEQMRLRDHPFCLGVQFHPERDWLYAPLFEEFFGRLGK